MPFIRDAACLSYVINEPYSGAKSTYVNFNIDFTGARDIDPLMQKIRYLDKLVDELASGKLI